MSAPDIHAITARRVHSLPDDWQPRIYGCLERGLGFYLEGAVPIGNYSKGPRKGQPKFPAKRELQQVVITSEEVQETRDQWERETGLCHRCGGSGEVVAIVSRNGRPCRECGGTGKARHLREVKL